MTGVKFEYAFWEGGEFWELLTKCTGTMLHAGCQRSLPLILPGFNATGTRMQHRDRASALSAFCSKKAGKDMATAEHSMCR